MKPETNLFLRSLVGREKSRLKQQIDEILNTPGFSAEGGNQLVAALTERSKCNDALTALREESREQYPATPPLSDDTANRIRKALGLYVDTLRKAAASVGELLQLLPDDKKLIQARFDAFRLIEQARQDLNEFNAAFPEEVRK